MIGKLTGRVDSAGEDWSIIDVGGVGYRVYCSRRTLTALGAADGQISLLIETHVREDHIHLYGFIDQAERDWFRLLGTVQGVGAKVALAVLSALSPDRLIQAIAAQDKAQVARANGVGPKMATRIVTELKDKAGGFALGSLAAEPAKGAPPPDAKAADEAVSALINLGYQRTDAFGVVAKVSQRLGQDAPLESLVKDSLRELSR